MTRFPPIVALWLALVALCALGVGVPVGFADDTEPTIDTPRPERWLPSRGRECNHRGRYRSRCEGPRRAPEPYGKAATLADELGLGTRKAAGQLLSKRPTDAWVQAVGTEPTRTLLWPVPDGRMGRGFGYTRKRRKEKLHKGIDISAEEGAFVRSVNDGIVAYSDNGISGYGNVVLVVHADHSVSLYAHHRANYVFAGQHVRRGQVIGEVGQTGFAWGPHLHFEWRHQGRPRDPMRRMVGRTDGHHDEAGLLLWM